jgi:hypothetical protein
VEFVSFKFFFLLLTRKYSLFHTVIQGCFLWVLNFLLGFLIFSDLHVLRDNFLFNLRLFLSGLFHQSRLLKSWLLYFHGGLFLLATSVGVSRAEVVEVVGSSRVVFEMGNVLLK